MLTEITLGQYFPGNSWIHRLDPRTKILATIIYIIAIFFADTPLSYGILSAFAALFFGADVYDLSHRFN